MNKPTPIKVLVANVILLLFLLALPIVNAGRSAGPPQSLKGGQGTKIALWASGRGSPQLALQDGSVLPEDRGDRDPVLPPIPTALAQGDFNGDGITDIVTSYAQMGGGELAVRFGNGRGDFTWPLRVKLAGEDPTAIVVDDFNNDGNLDIAVSFSDREIISIYSGTGQGLFRWTSDLDLGLTVNSLASGDFNRDGFCDLVAASNSPLLAFLAGDGQGGFDHAKFFSVGPSGEAISLGAVQAADLDDDGLLDLAVTYRGQSSGAAILYGKTETLFSFPTTLFGGGYFHSLAVGDFNNDGRLDITATDGAGGNVVAFFGGKDRSFSPPTSFYAGLLPGPMAAANLNGDGYPDLAVINRGSNQVAVLLGSSDGSFNAPVNLDVAGDPMAVLAGRFNADALDDLVVAKRGGASLVLSLSVPPTLTVNTAADEVKQDGKVTLREAILAANGTPPNSEVPSGRGSAPDVIGFDIPDAEKVDGVFTIRVSSSLGPLPALTDGGTTIDGSTQKGFSATPIIVIDGSAVGSVDGFTINSSLNALRSLAITGFGGNGVKIAGSDGPVTGNIIAGCSIGGRKGNGLSGIVVSGQSVDNTLIGGTDSRDQNVISGNGSDGIQIRSQARGTQIVGNYIGGTADGRELLPNGGNGISINGSDNTTIGGTQEGSGNVISANMRNGIQVQASSGTRIQRNRVGLNALGTDRLGNGGDGVMLAGDAFNTLIGGASIAAQNLISGNSGNGVTLLRSSTNKIQGNHIGTNVVGNKAIGNGGAGVLVDLGSQNNLIGGAVIGSGNLISGNGAAGVLISQNSFGNQLLGNMIGLDATQRGALGNGGDGVSISGGGDNLIGGSEAGARNLIGGNAGDGIKILNSINNRIVGNYIGTDVTGKLAVANGGNGVLVLSIEGSASQNVMLQNVIAYNGGAGVKILSSGYGNRLSQNSIFSNGELGIDRGGRSLLPQITSIANSGGGSVTVKGAFRAAAPEGATIEVYLADPDPSGRGEGKTYLVSAKADARGAFSAPLSGMSNGALITATATDFRGDTSEFAANFTVDMEAPRVTVVLPNGGEAIRSGTTFCISWRASDNVGVVGADILLSTDGGANFTKIGSASADSQLFCWNAPLDLTTNRARIRVVARDAAGNVGQDESDADFGVDPNAPVVNVLVPNGGEVIPGTSKFTIRWSALGNMASCDVLLSANSGATFIPLATGLAGSETAYLWEPGRLSTAHARIRVACTDTSGRKALDDSDGDFTVDSVAPTVAVLTPNGGEIVRGGTIFKIQWNSSDDLAVASQDLLLSIDGGVNFVPLPDAKSKETAGLPGNQQSFEWDVPLRLGSNQARVCVRARDLAGNETQDCSDANFTLVQVEPGVIVLSPNGSEIIPGGSMFTIRWSSTGNITLHDIFLSTDGGATFPITVVSGLAATVQSYDWVVPNNLSTSRGRIRVVARNATGRVGQDESDGDFIIDSQPPTVRVIVPNGDEVIRGGDTFKILWEASDDVRLVTQSVQLSTDSGASYKTIATLDGEPRSFEWKVPLTLFTPTGRIRVIVQDVAGKTAQDDSDGSFVVTPNETEPPAVRIISPNGGERIAAESKFTIQWESTDNIAVAYCDVLLSTDGGATFNAIALRLRGNPQSYDWQVPDIETTQARVGIRCQDYAGNQSQDWSDFIFTIYRVVPSVRVIAPNGGEIILGGSTYTVRWESANGAVSQDILLSLDGGATFSTVIALGLAPDVQSYTWSVPTTLSTAHGRIRVVAYNARAHAGLDDSDANFIIDSQPPTVRVIVPNGDEVIRGGSTFKILWDASDDLGLVSQSIQLSTDGGATYTKTIVTLGGEARSFDWTVPLTLFTPTGRIRVIVQDVAGKTAQDDSDGNFVVTPNEAEPPVVRVISPNGGERIAAESKFTIQWESSDNIAVAYCDVLLSADGGATFNAIALRLRGNPQSYDWQVPDIETTQARIGVRCQDYAGNQSQDASDFNFTIYRVVPSVRVIAPNGDEIILGGSTYTIQWESSNGVATQDILLSLDGGATFSIVIASGLAADVQSYAWTVPTTVSTAHGRIRVVARNAKGYISQDESDGDFIIDSQSPKVRVIVPNGDEVIRGGDIFKILWEASDDVGLVSQAIQLSTDGGASFKAIATLGGEPRSFEWKVPLTLFTPTAQIRVIVQDVAGKTAQDDSDGNFVVTPNETEPPAVRVISPNGGERIAAESAFTIRWESSDNIAVAYCDVLLSTDGGATFNAIALRLRGNPQSYDWQVPDIETTQARVGVRCQDYAGNITQDASDFNFTIYRVVPSVRVIAPNGGEIILGGSTYTIQWASSGGVVSQDILLSLDGGATFSIVIASGLAAEAQSYNWSVPTTLSTARGRIRVVAYNTQGHFGWDDSDGDFIIDSQPPSVRVASPNGGEVFRGNERFDIIWKASDDVRLVRQTIQISTDGGATFSNIITLDGNDPQLFRWKVPLTLFTLHGRIRVIAEDVAGKVTQDTSDADFWVIPLENELPFARLLSPNGGEIVAAGAPFTITWQSSDNVAVQYHDLLLSVDGGTTFNPIVERLPGDVQSYVWDVPAGLSSTTAIIALRVRDYAGNVATDVSDRVFAIDGLSPTVSSVTVGPGIAFLPRGTMTITWEAFDDVRIASQVIDFSRDGGTTWQTIAQLSANVREYGWKIPVGSGTSNGRIRVTARDTCGRTGSAVSVRFTIVAAP